MLHTLRTVSPSLRRLLIGQVVSVFGDALFLVAVTLVLGTENGARELTLFLACEVIGSILILPIGGYIADTVNRRTVLLTTDAARVVLVVAVLVTMGTSPPAVLGVLAFLMGATSAASIPVAGSLISDLIRPQDDRQNVNALRGLALKSSAVLGAGAAGVLVVILPATWLIPLDAVTFVISFLFITGVREPRPAHELANAPSEQATTLTTITAFTADVAQGFAFIKGIPWMGVVMIQGVVQVGLILGPEALILRSFLDGDAAKLYPWAVAVAGAGAIAGSIAAAKIRTSLPGLVAMLCILLLVPQFAAMAFGAHVGVVIALGFFKGFGYAVFGVLWITSLQVHTPSPLLGRVLSFDALANMAAQPAGLFLVRELLDVYSLTSFLQVAVIVLLVTTVAPLLVPGVLRFGGEVPPTKPTS